MDIVDELLKEKKEAMCPLDKIEMEDEYFRNEFDMNNSEHSPREVELIIISSRSESDFTQRLKGKIKECERILKNNDINDYFYKKTDNIISM